LLGTPADLYTSSPFALKIWTFVTLDRSSTLRLNWSKTGLGYIIYLSTNFEFQALNFTVSAAPIQVNHMQAVQISTIQGLKHLGQFTLQTAVNRHFEETNTNLPRKNSCCMTTWLQTSGKAKSKIFGRHYLPAGVYISSTLMKAFGLKQTKTILVFICWAKAISVQ
jgi:hypothetical protein